MNKDYSNNPPGENLNVLPPDAKYMVERLTVTIGLRLEMQGVDRNSPEGINIAYQVFKEFGWWKDQP